MEKVVLKERNMQPQPQPQPMESKSFLVALATGKIDFTIKDGTWDSIPRNSLKQALAEAICVCGTEFYGIYTLCLCPQDIQGFAQPGIVWLPHDIGQSGLGFTFGKVNEAGKVFKARRYSILPPEGVDVNALYAELTGDCTKIARVPTLTLVQPTPVAPPPTSEGVPVMLAESLRKVRALRREREDLQAEDRALDAELLLLERQVAEAPNVDALVEARVQQLLA